MKPYMPSLYDTPIDLPRGKSGKVSIAYRMLKGEAIVVSMRQAILRNTRPAKAILAKPRRIHELREEGEGLWMTDLPEELNQIGEMLHVVKPYGNVLVGGLGLGILPAVLVQNEMVRDITVVERSKDIIKLCRGKGYKVANADITEFIKRANEEQAMYDFYLLDTWQGTNAMTWWGTVLPLRRLIRNRWGDAPVVHCWAEDIMQGQILSALLNPATRTTWYTYKLPLMSEGMARKFMNDVGTRWWERKYGGYVDAAVARMKESE